MISLQLSESNPFCGTVPIETSCPWGEEYSFSRQYSGIGMACVVPKYRIFQMDLQMMTSQDILTESLFIFMWQKPKHALLAQQRGDECLVWAPRRGRTQTSWPRQIYQPNWETPSPSVFLFSLLPSWEKTQSSRTRASKPSLSDIEYWVLKWQGSKVPAQKTQRQEDFPANLHLHILGLLELSAGEI